ncbi:hypothetical protein, partial [Sulfitobacter sp.]|uniref:hypothetical protein n=1 Tax=Sulfitobacter sp. TaxID=1903071 RepID=UPI003EF20D53
MHIQTRTLALFAAVAALALTACDDGSQTGSTGSDTDSSAAEASSEDGSGNGAEAASAREPIAMGGTGWLTIGNDGAVQTTFLDSDGRFRDFRNGELLAEGNWERMPDERLCFEPDAGRGDCWEVEAPDADGT